MQPGKAKCEVDDDNSLSPNFVRSAMGVHSNLLKDPLAVVEILELEDHFGPRSFLHKMSGLHAPTKPPTAQMHLWVLTRCSDQIFNDETRFNSDVSKGTLGGDRTHIGYVQLFQLKWDVPNSDPP